MKKSTKSIIYAIYVVILIAYIIGIQLAYDYLNSIFLLNPLVLMTAKLSGALIFGVLLGIPKLIKLKFDKKGHYSYNLAQALIIGIPTLLVGISIFIYYATDIYIPRILYYNNMINEYSLIVTGLIAIVSIDKK